MGKWEEELIALHWGLALKGLDFEWLHLIGVYGLGSGGAMVQKRITRVMGDHGTYGSLNDAITYEHHDRFMAEVAINLLNRGDDDRFSVFYKFYI